MRHSRFRGCAPTFLPVKTVERLQPDGRYVRSNRTGSRVNLRGINQGTWGENYSGDAGTIAGYWSNHVRLLIRSNLNGPLQYESGVDAYEDNGTNYFKATHSAQFLAEIDWAGASKLWAIVAYDTDQGQGVGRQNAPATGWDFFDGSPEAAAAEEKFWKGWEWIATQCVGRPYILAYELLPEPLPYNSTSADAAPLREFFRRGIARIRAIDPYTPFLIGPRGSYGPNNIEEAYLSERTDCKYTIDVLTNRTSSEGTIAALLEGFAAWLAGKNAFGIVQQLGRNTSEDIGDVNADGVADTTENIGLTAMNGAMSLCNALGIPFTWWQLHQNTNNAGAYALFFKTNYPGSGPDNWTPKPLEIASCTYHMKQNGPQVVAAAEAAAAAASLNLFRIHGDLSNVFQDTAGTTPCTAVGQSVARINAVVGSMYFSQATAANRPTLVQLSNGEYALSFGGTHWLDSSNVTYYGTTDDTLVTVAGRATASALNRVMFHNGLAAAIVRYPYIAVLATDDVQVSWRGDDNVHYGAGSTTLCDDRAIVVTARKVGNAKLLRLQGVQEGTTNNSTVGTITGPFTRMRWGANSTGGNGFTGTMPMLCVGKSATDEQARAISRLGAWLIMAPYRGAIPA